MIAVWKTTIFHVFPNIHMSQTVTLLQSSMETISNRVFSKMIYFRLTNALRKCSSNCSNTHVYYYTITYTWLFPSPILTNCVDEIKTFKLNFTLQNINEMAVSASSVKGTNNISPQLHQSPPFPSPTPSVTLTQALTYSTETFTMDYR